MSTWLESVTSLPSIVYFLTLFFGYRLLLQRHMTIPIDEMIETATIVAISMSVSDVVEVSELAVAVVFVAAVS